MTPQYLRMPLASHPDFHVADLLQESAAIAVAHKGAAEACSDLIDDLIGVLRLIAAGATLNDVRIVLGELAAQVEDRYETHAEAADNRRDVTAWIIDRSFGPGLACTERAAFHPTEGEGRPALTVLRGGRVDSEVGPR